MKNKGFDIFDRAYWVIPDKLLAGPYPGDLKPEEADKKLRGLIRSGIRVSINLMEEDEVDFYGNLFVPYQDRMQQLAEERDQKVRILRIPVKDMNIPTRKTMQMILDEIDQALAQDEPVYVHCWGGVGRTGTVVGCYLIRHGLAVGKAALEEINFLRRHTQNYYYPSPQTPAQCNFVRSWTPGD